MQPELYIWRAADLLLSRHADRAEEIAMHEAEEMNERNDFGGQLVWLQIIEVIRVRRALPASTRH